MCGYTAASSMSRKRRSKPHKIRPKPKKPKFLSLRRKFPAKETKEIEQFSGRRLEQVQDVNGDDLNLFSPQPDNRVEDGENYDHENVAVFFSAADGSDTTLTDLLDTSADHESSSSLTGNNNSHWLGDMSPSSASLTYAFYREDPSPLVRNALRSRERDARDEKWVSYSEVVKEEEVSSSGGLGIQRLLLKLDYDEIINTWSNKGSLYVDGETPQIVPDIYHQNVWLQSTNQEVNWGYNAGCWKVPEMVGEDENGETRLKEVQGQREASVLRYKEKRRNRKSACSRKIRYQVRKLNAEKRPRFKGRFVKTC